MKPDRIKYVRNISPEAETFCSPKGMGPLLMRNFFRRYLNGQKSMRGNNYETVKDYSWRSAESKIYHDRMVES